MRQYYLKEQIVSIAQFETSFLASLAFEPWLAHMSECH